MANDPNPRAKKDAAKEVPTSEPEYKKTHVHDLVTLLLWSVHDFIKLFVGFFIGCGIGIWTGACN